MAEKINILELDIDIDAIVKSTSAFKAQLDAAKESLKQMQKAGDTSSATYVRQKAEVDRLNAEYRVSQRELTKLTSISNKENLSIKEARNLLSVVSSQWAEQAKLYGENSEQAEALAKQKKQLTDRLKEEEKKTGDTSRNVGNYAEGMKEALAGTKLFGNEISTVTQFLSLYSGIFKALKTDISNATTQIFSAAKGTETMTKAQKAAAITTNAVSGALKLLKIALISTGIGAIVVLLGSLVAYFSQTQKGIDTVNRVLTPLKEVFASLIGILQEVGEFLASLFTADGIKAFGQAIKDFVVSRIELVSKGFGAIGKFITGDFKAGMQDLKEISSQIVSEVKAGVDALANAGTQLSERMAEAYRRGQQIQQLQEDIERGEINLIKRGSELNLITKEQNKIAEDIRVSDAERAAAAQKAIDAQKELLQIQAQQLDMQIQQKQLQQEANDTSREEEKELAELIAQRNEIQTAVAKTQTTLQNKLNTIEQQRYQKAIKAQDELIKKSKAELDLFIEQNSVKAQNLDKEVELAEKIRDRKLQILDQEVKAGKKTKEEAALEEFRIKQEYLDKQTEAVISTADRELQAVIQANESKLEADQYFSEQSLQQEEERLQRILDAQKAFFDLQLQQGVISQEQYNQAINDINRENQDKLDGLRQERADAEEEKRLIDLENRREIEDENFLNDFERRQAQLEIERQQEIDAAEQTGASVDLINQKYSKKKEQLDREEELAKIEGQQNMINTLGNLAAAFFGDSKALTSALVLADTTLAAQKAYLSQFLPVPDLTSPARGTVAAGIALAQGLARVAQVNNIKFEDGGLLEVGGQRHSAGGTKFVGEDGTTFEAEQGELIGVLNRRAAANFMKYNNSFLSGGRSGRRNFFADGGIVQRGVASGLGDNIRIIQPSINADELAAKIAQANTAMPSPVVAVEDINLGQNRLSNVVSGANI